MPCLREEQARSISWTVTKVHARPMFGSDRITPCTEIELDRMICERHRLAFEQAGPVSGCARSEGRGVLARPLRDRPVCEGEGISLRVGHLRFHGLLQRFEAFPPMLDPHRLRLFLIPIGHRLDDSFRREQHERHERAYFHPVPVGSCNIAFASAESNAELRCTAVGVATHPVLKSSKSKTVGNLTFATNHLPLFRLHSQIRSSKSRL